MPDVAKMKVAAAELALCETCEMTGTDRHGVPCACRGKGWPEEWGWFRWLERRIGLPGVGAPPVSRWWGWALREFWVSGKPELAALVGMRGTKSHTMCRVAVAEALFRERKPVLGTDLVWGIYSCDMHEANGRASTLTALLGALGFSEATTRATVESGSYFRAGGSGRSSISTYDVTGNPIEFRISPATSGGASGYTGIGITCDELDLWKGGDGNSNAAEVLSVLGPRLFGQTGARMYRISAPFSETSPHTRDVRQGDNDAQHVARLGVDGAKRDDAAREALALMFEDRARGSGKRGERERYGSYASDARLREKASPDDYRIPTWVARDGDLAEVMRDCWMRAAKDAGADGSDPLALLFARFGARPYGATGSRLIDPMLIDRAARQVPRWA